VPEPDAPDPEEVPDPDVEPEVPAPERPEDVPLLEDGEEPVAPLEPLIPEDDVPEEEPLMPDEVPEEEPLMPDEVPPAAELPPEVEPLMPVEDLPAEEEPIPDAPPAELDAPDMLTPRALAVSLFTLPVAWRFFAFWKSLNACCVFGPITPSIGPGSCPWLLSASCTCRMFDCDAFPDAWLMPDRLLLPCCAEEPASDCAEPPRGDCVELCVSVREEAAPLCEALPLADGLCDIPPVPPDCCDIAAPA
jgi:hypothetical protein